MVNTTSPGALRFIVGDPLSRDASTALVEDSRVGLFVVYHRSDGYKVYPCSIEDADHLVSKTAMTCVEGENCRITPLLSTLAPQDPVLFQAVAISTSGITSFLKGLKSVFSGQRRLIDFA